MAKSSVARIYLDHAATTPLCLEAKEVMSAWLSENFGNPSSLHAEGRKAKDAIDSVREILSSTLGSLFAEVLFTSGGTEAANLAIIGTALNHVDSARRRILLGAAEHHCVIHTKDTLELLGFQVEFIPVDREARINLNALENLIHDDVLLISCMHANNELGTINPIRTIAEITHKHGALLHVDAVQTFMAPGLNWKVADLDPDILTVSAHKIYGPKGVGAIYIRAGVKLKPLITGGGQEREMRGGTENVAAILGFGEAIKVAHHRPVSPTNPRDTFRDHLISLGAIPSVWGDVPVLRGHAHFRFPDIDAETMLIVLDRLGVSASSGSACSSGSIEPSHVLIAAGYSDLESRQGLRFTFGRATSTEDANGAAERVKQAVSQIRQASR